MSHARPEYAVTLAAIGVLLAIGIPAFNRGQVGLGGMCVGAAVLVAGWAVRGVVRERGLSPRRGSPLDGSADSPIAFDGGTTDHHFSRHHPLDGHHHHQTHEHGSDGHDAGVRDGGGGWDAGGGDGGGGDGGGGE